MGIGICALQVVMLSFVTGDVPSPAKAQAMSCCSANPAEPVRLALDPEKVLNRIDEKVYGHFLEHIFHSANGGLWGEMIWDRSFEGTGSATERWKPYGPGKVEPCTENPLNGSRCLRISGQGGETGVQQAPLCIRAKESYHGSLWCRGEPPEGLVVRLLSGSRTIAQQRLPSPEHEQWSEHKDSLGEWRGNPRLRTPGPEWREYRFALKPDAAADQATIQIGLCGEGQAWIDQASLMSEAARQCGGFRPDLLEAVAQLRPPVIRWPGGSFAGFYRWKDGIGPQHKRRPYPRAMWDDLDVNSLGTDEFAGLCRRVGAEPLVVINAGVQDRPELRDQYCQEACQWLEYCNGPATSTWGKVRAANGHPKPYGVKYWELDNECWRLRPEAYAGIVRQFAAELKQIDPSIKIIACGSGQLGRYWPDGDGTILARCAGQIDYLSVHHYEQPERFADGPIQLEKFWGNLAERIAKSANPHVKLYMSEWNAQSTDWRTGLYAGGFLNAAERNGDVLGMAGPALFLRHVSARGWDNALVNFDHRTWFPAPNYVVMKLWRENYAPLRIELAGQSGPLSLTATRDADAACVYLKAVNPADRAVPVEVTFKEGFSLGNATMQLIAPDSLGARNSLEHADVVRAKPAAVEIRGRTIRFTLPRWSAAAIKATKA
jgi:alpha-N-arabinofuranosidase